MDSPADSFKLDRILELLEKQERRARWGVVWKFIWIFLIFILPLYLSFKMIGNVDTGAFTRLIDGVQEAKDAIPQSK